jgi:hypothetical protein
VEVAQSANGRQADPVELELLFKFVDGFASRVPEQVHKEFAVNPAT